MYCILVQKKTGYLTVVIKGSKKYRRLKKDHKEYKQCEYRKPLEIETSLTNDLIMDYER